MLVVVGIKEKAYAPIYWKSHCACVYFCLETRVVLSWISRLYYQHVPEGKEYPVLCRRLATEKNGWMETVVNYLRGRPGKEEILLDWNEIAEQYGQFFSYLLV